MARRDRKSNERRRRGQRLRSTESALQYQQACELALSGNLELAATAYNRFLEGGAPSRLRALAQNDLAVLATVRCDWVAAREGFAEARRLDRACRVAEENLSTLDSPVPLAQTGESADGFSGVRPDGGSNGPAVRLAIVSFLFNWPSTGGGIFHTVELADFLGRDGFCVQHFYVRYEPWGIGTVTAELPIASQALEFAEADWDLEHIQTSVRQAVRNFDPDHVIITDTWNMKPLLAEAVREYPYILRQQALECLCPLNNLRLLPGPQGTVEQCPLDQLSAPHACHQCLLTRGNQSGGLHQAERMLSQVGTAEYDRKLRQALSDAEAVLVLNPSIETLLKPFANNVRVVTWGMDPARFPESAAEPPRPVSGKKTILMAGVIEEFIKGFHVLHAACEHLWRKRQDFELWATGRPKRVVDDFTRFTGWISQEELPDLIRRADMLVMPTVAQEGLGRTTVEAMAVGRPVIASRIGGLPYTVTDGVTGLLCEPGNPVDLAEKIERLLDDPQLCQRMGRAGRARFERDFTWPVVIERHYRPLLDVRQRSEAS